MAGREEKRIPNERAKVFVEKAKHTERVREQEKEAKAWVEAK